MTERKRRGPGRPPITEGDTPARVHVLVPSRDFDRAHVLAERKGMSVPELVRRSLARTLEEDQDDD